MFMGRQAAPINVRGGRTNWSTLPPTYKEGPPRFRKGEAGRENGWRTDSLANR